MVGLDVACRRLQQHVVAGQAAGASGDEGAPLGGELGHGAAFGEGDQQTGLGGDLLAHAQFVEQHQASLDVPVGAVDVSGGVGDEALEPLHASLDEPITAVRGVPLARRRRRAGSRRCRR